MASQNMDPAAATSTAALKGSETGGSAARGSVSKRLQQELMTLMMSGDKGISAFPESDNLFKWIGTIDGAQGTVYEGLRYKLSLEFPSGYPYKAPRVKFITACYHPNVDEHGFICLDILKEKWSALYDVRSILLSIQSLLGEPNNESPMNAGAAELWENQEDTTSTSRASPIAATAAASSSSSPSSSSGSISVSSGQASWVASTDQKGTLTFCSISCAMPSSCRAWVRRSGPGSSSTRIQGVCTEAALAATPEPPPAHPVLSSARRSRRWVSGKRSCRAAALRRSCWNISSPEMNSTHTRSTSSLSSCPSSPSVS
ncbi:hypothetical protein JZ751_017952, partial [Albula glossodonta]